MYPPRRPLALPRPHLCPYSAPQNASPRRACESANYSLCPTPSPRRRRLTPARSPEANIHDTGLSDYRDPSP